MTEKEKELVRALHRQARASAEQIAYLLDLDQAEVVEAIAPPRVEDALWLLDAGEHPERVARRAGFPSISAMEKAMRRAGVSRPAVFTACNIERQSARAAA